MPAVVHAQASDTGKVEALAANAVRIEAGGRTGFGFIVGLDAHQILIATAWHTLRDLASTEVGVCFAAATERCTTGTIVYVADPIGTSPALDLAVVATPYPDGLPWRPDAFAHALPGEPVWFIGRSRDWYIPPVPGHVTGADSARQLVTYADLDVAEGVSGAPIVSAQGIVAMHVASVGVGAEAHGVDIHAIRERVVDRMRAHWTLVPRATCDDQDAHRRVLEARSITVHFDGNRPAAGLDAIARLNCLGARTLPQPLWSDDEWAATNTVVYASGEVRTARAVQAALAALGRLDTDLGQPAGDLAVWIR